MRREGDREGEKHPLVTSYMPPTKDLACNPVMCPNWELNWRPFALQDDAQPTETHTGHTGQGMREKVKLFFSFLFQDFIYLFLGGREGDREEEKRQCVVSSQVPPTGDLACNPGIQPAIWESNCLVCRPALNPLSHTTRAKVKLFK